MIPQSEDKAGRLLPPIADFISRTGPYCAYCKRLGSEATDPDGNPWERDHKLPRFRGGSNDIENLCLSCRNCNRRKLTKTSEEFLGIVDTLPPLDRRITVFVSEDTWHRARVAAANADLSLQKFVERAISEKIEKAGEQTK